MQARLARGFTLTELMVVLAIAAIVVMLGAPAMGGLLARTQDAATETALAGSLRNARSAAVMRNARVVVCPSVDGRTCRAGDDWQRGWIIAQDADHDGQPDAGTPPLNVESAPPAGTRVITSIGRGKITFQPSGSAGGANARFTICHARNHSGKSVIVANSGRIRVDRATPDRLAVCLDGFD